MVFSTTLFVFLFLPLFLGVYYALPFRYRSAWILAASLTFYGWWRVDFLALFVLTTVWTYLLGRAIARGAAERDAAPRDATPHDAAQGTGTSRGRRALAAGVVLNLGTLGYFKYFNFGVDSLNALLTSLGASGVTAWEVVLPIGISFYVFQATSYLIDVYRGDAPPAERYLDLAAYITLFPQLVAGPIVRYHDIAPQLRRREHTFSRFAEGSGRFMIGFGKKVLIADTVAVIADAGFALPAPTVTEAWLGTVAYAVQIYFDFSGYSDMAIGLGLMIGFRFRENFRDPYLSRSITEFWRRWHISLSQWLRNYLYIPLGGNRRGRRRTYTNLMTVMVLGGLWHGAAWTFVLWGFWHGLWLAVERAVAERGGARRLTAPGAEALSRVYALAVVLIGWVLFRAPDLAVAMDVLFGMVGGNGVAVTGAMAWQLDRFSLIVLVVAILVVVRGRRIRTVIPRSVQDVAYALLFVFSIVKLAAEQYSPFLYFQF